MQLSEMHGTEKVKLMAKIYTEKNILWVNF